MANFKKQSGLVLADSLRKAVLQAAIQGQLVPQMADDGQASDLLSDIQAEKKRLIDEKVIKKEKPLAPIMDDEKPFDIPDSWVWVRLGDLAQFVNGDRSSNYPIESDFVPNGIPFFGAKDMLNQKLRFTENLRFISQEKFDSLSQGKLANYDFVCLLRGSIGKTAIFENFKDYTTGFINAQMVIIRLIDKNAIIINFLNRILSSDYFSKFILQVSSGTAVKQLSAETLRNFLLPLPPLAEQERIVKKLDEILPQLDDLAKSENALNALQSAFPKQMQSALLQSAISGKLTEQLESDGNASDLLTQIQAEKQRLIDEKIIKREKPLAEITDDEKPFDIPDNWIWVRLGDVTDYGQGRQTMPKDIPLKSLVIEMEDIEKDTFKLLDKNYNREPKSSKNAFKKGDILYGKLRPYLRKIIIVDEDGYCSTEIIPFNAFGILNNRYLQICLASPFVNSFVNSITHGMDMPRLGTDKARNILIPLPPLAEQERIVAKLDELLPQVQALTV